MRKVKQQVGPAPSRPPPLGRPWAARRSRASSRCKHLAPLARGDSPCALQLIVFCVVIAEACVRASLHLPSACLP